MSEGFTRFMAEQVLQGKERATIALSGGSTPKTLFDYWGRHKTALNWDRLLFFWGDERCVPPDDSESNYGMTCRHLFDHVAVPPENIFRIKGENDPEKEALRYSEVLSGRLAVENDVPTFDLVMLGLGDDGHTVSIFPAQIGLWNSPANCIASAQPETGMKRVSITGKIVNHARQAAFLVTGRNKADSVRNIIRQRDKFMTAYPAARVCPLSQEIHWFLDEQAAEGL
ncbi:MAG: 6-phosphogluconolactonase [Prevotella sp.]|nr:6-phosphogluconolactonase [Prevotella sp.]